MRRLRAILAMLRAGFLSASSYRMRFMMSLASVLLTTVPVYFVANALQPMMAPNITGQGRAYFDFLVLGFVVMSIAQTCVNTLPNQVGGDINNGFFEALTGAPVGLPTVLAGLMSYPVAFALLKNTVLLLLGVALGLNFFWAKLPAALLVVVLIVIAHFGVGLIATAAMIAFRTTLAIPDLLLTASSLFGGVYWPTSVIPTWVSGISHFFPLTYGLLALRRLTLQGESLGAVRNELLTLVAFAGFLLVVGVMALTAAMSYARRRGTLSYY